MDLQTRKLNIIAYLAQMQDEDFFRKIEHLILGQSKEATEELRPFTVEELVLRLEKSEEDYRNGDFKTQEEIEEISSNW